jgi:hypothetical protein
MVAPMPMPYQAKRKRKQQAHWVLLFLMDPEANSKDIAALCHRKGQSCWSNWALSGSYGDWVHVLVGEVPARHGGQRDESQGMP